MTLPERIDSDLKDAMRAQDAVKLGVLRMLKSAIKYSAIEKAGGESQLDDAEAAQVIRKQVKQRQDSIEKFRKRRPARARRERERRAGNLDGLFAAGPERRRADQNCSRDDRRGWCEFEGADGRGDESAARESSGPSRWQSDEWGSAEAVGMRETSNVQRSTFNVQLRSFYVEYWRVAQC